MNSVIKKPGIYLNKIKSELQDFLMLDIGVSAICKCLKKNGFSCQRFPIALKQDTILREKFILGVSV